MNTDSPSRRVHPVVRVSYPPRIIAHLAFAVLVISTLPREETLLIALLLFVGLVWPQAALLLGLRGGDSRTIGYNIFLVDSFLSGLYVAVTHLSPLPSFVLIAVATGVNVMMGGWRLFARGSLSLLASLIIWTPLFGIDLTREASTLTTSISIFSVSVFFLITSYSINQTTRRMIETRRDIREKNEQITEKTQQLKRALEEISYINEVGRTVNATLDINRVMVSVMAGLQKIFRFNQVAIFLLDADGQQLRLDRQYGGGFTVDLIENLRGFTIPTSRKESTFIKVVDRRESVFLGSFPEDTLFRLPAEDRLFFKYNPVQSILLSPLEIEGRVIGAIFFGDTGRGFELSDSEIHTIERYATHVATAIKNTMLLEQAEEARRVAEEANQTKSRFLANMSHELRTPMNAIIGYSEMLLEDAEDEGLTTYADDLKKIRGAGKHLLDLINGVLDLSKIEAGKTDLFLEDIDVRLMIDDILSTIDPVIKKNNNRLVVDFGPDVHDQMYSDVTKLRQSIINLLSNAAKFTENGTITMRIHSELLDGRPWMKFDVIDSGIGMTPEQLAKLFQPFTQADVSTTRKYGGTGLGLTITQRFCKMLGGSIQVESEIGKGTSFTISLPAEVIEQKGRRKRPDILSLTSSGTLRLPSLKSHVLVIDDDPAVRDMLQRFLEKEGFEVTTAENGVEGLTLAREIEPDAITLDALMPEMDGWTVLARLKADQKLGEIPVVMVTMVDDRSRAFSLGASEYLTKPVSRESLVEVLKRCLPRTSRRRLLVVEDDPAQRDRLRYILEKEGCTVLEAENGRVALELLRNGDPPELVTLDLMMPEMDGFEFLEEFRSVEQWRSIPVIVMTAMDLTEEDRRRLNGHVERVLQKGRHDSDDVMRELRQIFRSRLDLTGEDRRQS